MFLLFWTFGTLDYKPIFEGAASFFEAGRMVQFGRREPAHRHSTDGGHRPVPAGVAGNRPRFPLYLAARRDGGPTPVSALIHAATMVTAGVYLLVRSNVLYEIVRESGTLILGLISHRSGGLDRRVDGLFAGLIAFSQNDIKKVLAYSTVSQLGFMVAAAGMGAYVAAMFHLITHAFFKALLFLGSGSVIHGMEHGHHEVAHGHEGATMTTPRMTALIRRICAIWAAAPRDADDLHRLHDRRAGAGGHLPAGRVLVEGRDPAARPDPQFAHLYRAGSGGVGHGVLRGSAVNHDLSARRATRTAEHAHESPPLATRPLVVLASWPPWAACSMPYLSAATAERNEMHPQGFWLLLEQWEEHSIPAFELSEEGLIHLPHTPVVFSPVVAGTSLLLALPAWGWLI